LMRAPLARRAIEMLTPPRPNTLPMCCDAMVMCALLTAVTPGTIPTGVERRADTALGRAVV